MFKDKFEYTPTGILEALAWLRATGTIGFVTECNGSVDNQNAVSYANLMFNKLYPPPVPTLTYKDIFGEEEPKDDNNETQQETKE